MLFLFHVRGRSIEMVATRGLLLSFATAAVAAKECSEHFAEGMIPSTAGKFLCRKKGRKTFFATVYDTSIHCPKFSAYKMTPQQQKKDKDARKGFIYDPDVPREDQASPHDAPYKTHDIGHLAPSDAFAWDTSSGGAWEHTYMMTNVAPQGRYFNEHPWAMMERHAREFAINNNVDLFVITGVIQKHKPSMKAGDAIPAYYYKAICDLKNKQSFVSLGTNDNSCKDCGVAALHPVSKVEKMLGYKLFPASCGTSKVDEKHWNWSSKHSTIIV